MGVSDLIRLDVGKHSLSSELHRSSFRDAPSVGVTDQRRGPGIHNPCGRMAYLVYLLASKKHGTLYLGATNDIIRRGYEHRTKAIDGFTARYGVDKLVWFEI
jgi:hypothetical protein